MNFTQFKEQRIEELRALERCVGGLAHTNFVGGLLELIEFANPHSVLEIGADQGVSTECFLLNAARVVVVDSWEGSFWEPHYETFQEHCGTYPNLEVVRERSPGALSRFSIGEFDLVYIDGDHDANSVMRDIAASKRISKRWIAGHDYGSSVEAAVNLFLGKPERVFSDTSWIIKNV